MAAVNGAGAGWGYNTFNPQNYNLTIPKNTLSTIKYVGIALCGIGACVLEVGAVLDLMNPTRAIVGQIVLSILGLALLASRNVPDTQQDVFVAPQLPAVDVQQTPVFRCGNPCVWRYERTP